MLSSASSQWLSVQRVSTAVLCFRHLTLWNKIRYFPLFFIIYHILLDFRAFAFIFSLSILPKAKEEKITHNLKETVAFIIIHTFTFNVPWDINVSLWTNLSNFKLYANCSCAIIVTSHRNTTQVSKKANFGITFRKSYYVKQSYCFKKKKAVTLKQMKKRGCKTGTSR